MVAASASPRIAPADGDAFLISSTNRAPGCARTADRLRRVSAASERSESSETPSKRARSSIRLAAAISRRTPVGSATARLDETVEHPLRCPRRDRIERHDHAGPQVRGRAGGHQQGARVERDDRQIGGAALACEEPGEAARVVAWRGALDVLEPGAPQAGLLGRDLL